MYLSRYLSVSGASQLRRGGFVVSMLMWCVSQAAADAHDDQACRVVRYGTVTVCTVRTVLVKLRRTTVIVTHLGLARTVYIHRI